MKKRVFYREWAYILGLLFLAWGTAMTAWGNFGISMVVAPAYVLHLRISPVFPWFTFGVAEYMWQGFVLILLMVLLRKVRLSFFLSFLTAVIYGLVLDLGTVLLGYLPGNGFWQRLVVYILGDVVVCAGVAFMFQTYLPPDVYTLFVKELSPVWNKKVHILKTGYDCASVLIAVTLSLAFWGSVQGVGIGTVVCAFVNGSIIKAFSALYDRIWEFQNKLSYEKQKGM